MMRQEIRRSMGQIISTVCAMFCCYQVGRCDLIATEQQTDQGSLSSYRLTVTPAPEPSPALQHRLIPREIDLVAGNAATHYLRVFPEGGLDGAVRRNVEKFGQVFHEWHDPKSIRLGDVPLEEGQDASASFDSIVRYFIAPASLRRSCDWGLGIEEMRGYELLELPLPEFNASRAVSRILALRSRIAIAEGDFDKALRQLRMNYQLARNTAREPLLVCGLIGLAQARIGHEQIMEFIAAPGSPNLYWALAELRPLLDLRKAVHFEMSLAFRLFPFLREAEGANHTAEEWDRKFAHAVKSLVDAVQFPEGEKPFGQDTALIDRAGVVSLTPLLYPHAKQRLLDGGLAPQRVESMAAGQVVALDAAREYRRIADEMEKWTLVPYYEARKRKLESLFETDDASTVEQGLGYMIAKLLLPAVSAARAADARLEWQTGAMQVIEALRMHAAQVHRLPTSLEAIKIVPLPLNPATNAPYQYRLEANTAVLELPFADGFAGNVAFRFEIQLAQP